jgi:hypothetical protein
MTCDLCGRQSPARANPDAATDAAIEAGWLPSYWLDYAAEVYSPICGPCSNRYLHHDTETILDAIRADARHKRLNEPEPYQFAMEA